MTTRAERPGARNERLVMLMRGFFRNRRATSAVEFALIAPFLLLLVGAILAYGLLTIAMFQALDSSTQH